MGIATTISLAVLFLAGLLYFERDSNTTGVLLTKPVVSILFVLTAINQSTGPSLYFKILLTGLLLCLIGDVCLIFLNSKKMFLAGLGAFLTGHIAYAAAFYQFVRLPWYSLAALIIFTIIGIRVYQWLKPNLGTMKIPVKAYIGIITVMMVGAIAVSGNHQVPHAGRYLILSGALLFYVSDLFVARNQFVKKAYINRLVGLPLYFTGQFLLAASVAHVG